MDKEKRQLSSAAKKEFITDTKSTVRSQDLRTKEKSLLLLSCMLVSLQRKEIMKKENNNTTVKKTPSKLVRRLPCSSCKTLERNTYLSLRKANT